MNATRASSRRSRLADHDDGSPLDRRIQRSRPPAIGRSIWGTSELRKWSMTARDSSSSPASAPPTITPPSGQPTTRCPRGRVPGHGRPVLAQPREGHEVPGHVVLLVKDLVEMVREVIRAPVQKPLIVRDLCRPTVEVVAGAARASRSRASVPPRAGAGPDAAQPSTRLPRAAGGPATAQTELRHRPNRRARSMTSRWTRTIGVVVGDIQLPFFATIVRAMDDAAQAAGWEVNLWPTPTRTSLGSARW